MLNYDPFTRRVTIDPITTVVPFTRRNGDTYLTILERLAKFVNELTDKVNSSNSETVQAVVDALEQVKQDVDDMLSLYTDELDSKLVSVDTLVDELIDDVNNAVSQVVNSSIEVQDPVVAGILGDNESLTRVATDMLYRRSFNVLSYGAHGDGVTDDTDAIQATINVASSAGGGVVYFPSGTYLMRGYAQLKDNIELVGDGAVFTKPASAASYACFAVLSGNARGYGSGARNISATGLIFRGSLDAANPRSVCGFALHHADNVRIENCSFINSIISGHHIDLTGCSNVVVRDCTFSGFGVTLPGAIKHAESIQLDVSSKGAVSVIDGDNSYDALPTINVRVEGCRFTGSTDGGVSHPSPVALGMHSVSSVGAYRNIQFVNNTVEDIAENTTSGFYGAVHLVSAHDVLISGNVFESRRGLCVAVGLAALNTGVTPISAPAGGGVPVDPIPCERVTITNNTFTGFESSTTTYGVIFARNSHLAGAVHKHVNVVGNTFTAKTRGIEVSDHGQTFSRLQSCENVDFSSNIIEGAVRAVQLQTGVNFTACGNTVNKTAGDTFFIEKCSGATVQGNSVNTYRSAAVHARYGSGAVISGNSFTNFVAGDNGIRLTDNIKTAVTGNTINTADDVSADTAVSVAGTSECLSVGNISHGFTRSGVAGATATLTEYGNVNTP